MITVRTDRGADFARAEALCISGAHRVYISTVFYVEGEPTMRDFVFRTSAGGGH